jgi:hypothetical protein
VYVRDTDSLGGAICASAGCIGREPQLWSPSTACRSLPLFPPESGGRVWPGHRSVFIQIGMLSGRIAPPKRLTLRSGLFGCLVSSQCGLAWLPQACRTQPTVTG